MTTDSNDLSLVLKNLTQRNHCFVLNNVEFSNSNELGYLYGYVFDVNNIIETFDRLNFIVHLEENASADKMREVFHEWRKMDFSDKECLVFFILSHGNDHGVIYGSDGSTIHIDEIISIFSSCEQLEGKPKLFFMQACRGDMNPKAFKEEEFVASGPRLKKNSKFHDVFVYYCTTEGFAGFVSTKKGSHFIHAICEVLKQHGGEYSLGKLVTVVNKMLSETLIQHEGTSNAQVPEAAYTLRSDLLLGNYTSIKEDIDVDNDGNNNLIKQSRIKVFEQMHAQLVVSLQNQDKTEVTEKNKIEQQLMQLQSACQQLKLSEQDIKPNQPNVITNPNLIPLSFENQEEHIQVANLEQYHVKQKNPCIILTNTECITHKSQCENFNQDKQIIEETFTKLNFKIETKDNLKANEISCEFEQLKTRDFTDEDCLVCVVLSCGGLSGNLGVIYGTDGKHYSVDTMITKVNHNSTLKDKPKLFFMVVNRCNRNLFTSDEYVTSGGGKAKCKEADAFIYYVIVESENTRSLFITNLCNILLKYSCKGYHLGDVVLKVNELMCGDNLKCVEIPEACSTLTYQVYLNYAGPGCQQNIIEDDQLLLNTQATTLHTSPQNNLSGGSTGSRSIECTDGIFTYGNMTSESFQNSAVQCTSSIPSGNEIVVFPTTQPSEQQLHHQLQQLQSTQNNSGNNNNSNNNSNKPQKRVPTVEDLKHEHIMELKSFLDDLHSVSGNWLDLGKVIFQSNRDMVDEVTHLKRQYFGGGSPGKALIEYLKTDPDFTVKDFVDVAKKFKRKDILKLFENIPYNTPFDEVDKIDTSLCSRVAVYLDKDIRGAHNWRDFAFEFDCSEKQVKEFNSVTSSSSGSPTESLIVLIKSNKPQYNLSDLRSKLASIRRNDVAIYIDELIATLSATA